MTSDETKAFWRDLTVDVIIWAAIVVAAAYPDFFGPVPPLGIW